MKALSSLLVWLLVLAVAAVAQTDYRIGPQDVLAITVFGEPDLSGRFTVEQDGTFTFPLVPIVVPSVRKPPSCLAEGVLPLKSLFRIVRVAVIRSSTSLRWSVLRVPCGV
jgi:hypothetical protein